MAGQVQVGPPQRPVTLLVSLLVTFLQEASWLDYE